MFIGLLSESFHVAVFAIFLFLQTEMEAAIKQKILGQPIGDTLQGKTVGFSRPLSFRK